MCFFKQKTAYEMRISDWSSDVCSSDLDDSRDKKEMTMTTNSSPALQGSILVSGVGSLQGVGAAIARRFGREGYPVIIAGRSGDKLPATAELLEAEGIRIEAVSGDVAKSDDVQRFVAAVEELDPLAIAVPKDRNSVVGGERGSGRVSP